MAERGPRNVLLRPSRGGDGTRVSYVELFYDLVFVFAITQIAHDLVAQQDLATLGQTLLLTAAMWWLWVETAWLTNWLNPDHPAVRRMLFVLMLLGLVIASAIPEAFGDKAALFAVSFAVSLVGRGVFAVLAFRRSRPDHVRNFLRLTIWSATASVFWIAGGFGTVEARASRGRGNPRGPRRDLRRAPADRVELDREPRAAPRGRRRGSCRPTGHARGCAVW
jgi:low temperature requirement protein LtrA